jgi:hypothetical protein
MRARTSRIASLVAVVPFLAATSGAMSLERVIAAGDPAPGFAPGAVVVAFADAPRVERAGHVSFAALVRRADGTQAQAIYRAVNGVVERIAASGDAAPGTGNLRFVGFPFFPVAPFISGGRVAFVADAADSSGIGLAGVWTDRGGFLERLVLQAESLPGVPAGEEVTDFVLDTRASVALLRARFTRDSTQILNEENGLWRNADGTWQPVAVKGQAAAGTAGAIFDGDTPGFGTVSFFTARNDGRVLLQAWVDGGNVRDDNDEGLWVETAAGLQLLVREGSRAPLPATGGKPNGKGPKGGNSATFGPTSAFSPTFGGDNENATPSLNDAGQVVFGAALRTSSGRSGSIWTNRSGSLELIALGSLGLVGSGPTSPAPGLPSGTSFGTFQLTRISPTGRIAFLATARQADFFSMKSGVWWDVPGSLSLVAAVGSPVAGIPNATYSSIVQLDRFHSSDELAFEATVAGSGIDGSNNRGIFRARAGVASQAVLRTGQAVLTPGGPRTLRSFAWGEGRTAGDAGVATLTFTDGSSGIYLFPLAAAGS